MSWWRPTLKVQPGIFDAEGYFRTGRKTCLAFPLAELYTLTDVDDETELWWPPEQERLSYPVRWQDDYFQFWAEALALEHAGEVFPAAAWVIVAFDAAGNLTACVEYRPVVHDGALDDVAYGDAWASRVDAAGIAGCRSKQWASATGHK